jgi:hypothetical protein
LAFTPLACSRRFCCLLGLGGLDSVTEVMSDTRTRPNTAQQRTRPVRYGFSPCVSGAGSLRVGR